MTLFILRNQYKISIIYFVYFEKLSLLQIQYLQQHFVLHQMREMHLTHPRSFQKGCIQYETYLQNIYSLHSN